VNLLLLSSLLLIIIIVIIGRPRCRWEDNIRMDLGEIGGRCGVDSSGSG
jgi:hypothetical protein